MRDITRYYKFLSDEISVDLIRKAKEGLRGSADIPEVEGKKITEKQYRSRLTAARKLGLLYKCDGTYVLTSFGQLFLSNMDSLMALKPIEWMLRSIDNIKDPEMKLRLIHALFNKNPEIAACLARYGHTD